MHTYFQLILNVFNPFVENLTKTEFDHVYTLHGYTYYTYTHRMLQLHNPPLSLLYLSMTM